MTHHTSYSAYSTTPGASADGQELFFGFFHSTAAVANIATVTNLNDSGAGSLREALATVGPVTIQFAPGLAGTITLATTATVSANTQFDLTGAGAITIEGQPLGITGSLNVLSDSVAKLTINSALTGTGGIAKTGAGTLELGGTNTLTGAVSVSDGTLAVLNGNAIDNTSAVTVTGNATLALAGGGEAIGSLAGDGNVNLGAYNLTIGADGTSTTFSGVISGSGSGITKTGSGTLTLSGTNAYTGSTTVSGGTLALNGGAAIADASAVRVASGASLTLGASETIGSLDNASGTGGTVNLGSHTLTAGGNNTSTTFSGVLEGSGELAKTGTGSLTLSGASSSYTGTIAVNAGTLVAGSNGALGTVAGSTTVANGATLQVANGVTVADALSLQGAGAGGNGALFFAGSTGTASGTLTLDGGGNTTINAAGAATVAVEIAGSQGIQKTGSGTLTLQGDMGGGGGIDVNAGTLAMNGTLSNSGGASINVNSGGTLAGTGTISTFGGTVNVLSGGTLAPGNNGAGKLTISDKLNLASGSTLAVDITSATPGTGYDQVAVNDTVTITGATLAVTHGYTPGPADSYLLIDKLGGGSISGTFSGVAEGASLTAGGNGTPLKASYVGGTGNDFSLTAPAAPTVTSIVREGGAAQFTNATSVKYTVSFSQAVSGVDASDFSLTSAAGTVGTVTDTGAGTTYTVTVNDATAEGSMRLDLKSSGTGIATTVGSVAIASGFTGGEFYNLDHIAPTTTVASLAFSGDSGGSSTDLVTSAEGVIVSGTLGSANVISDKVQVSVDNGASWTDVTVAEGATTWSAPGQTLTAGSDTVKVRVTDRAGNHGPELSRGYTVDEDAPTLASASVNGSTLTLQYTDAVQLDAVNKAAAGAFAVMVAGAPVAVNAVTVDAAGKSVTLTLASAAQPGQAVTVAYTDPGAGDDTSATQDMAGNDAASFAATAVTNNTSPPGSGSPPPSTGTVDGVPITTTTGTNGATVTTIPVVPASRPETPGTPHPTLADIPLAKDASGQTLLQVGIPTGMGLQAEGLSTAPTGAAAQAELTQRIERLAGTGSELGPQAQAFLATLGSTEPLTVQTLKPTVGAGFVPGQPLVISGGSGQQAVIIDTSGLPSGTVIQVDGVEFVAIVGAVRVIGGVGQNTASGDGAAQWIVLGPDDDTIHGGGGNDTVGSEGGDDQIFGDAGDDTVFGGAGHDKLSGGTGSDRLNGGTGFDVAVQEGKLSDYSVTLEGAGIRITHTASGVFDWLVDVEQLRFETGPSLTVAHSAAEEAAAYLFQKWIGRDLTQSEGAIIQTLTGKTAVEVATLFAQVFPQQAAGKTPAQLLEGMAGAIRVDAIRDVTVTGDAGNNTISPTLGLARYVDGGAGIDTVVIPATLAQTHLNANPKGFTLQRMTDGAMLDLTHVERVSLNDTKLALDLSGHAGQAAKLLGALGGPALLANKLLVGEAIRALDAGASAQSLAGIGLQALGAQTPAQVVQLLWTNVMGRAGTQAELQPLLGLMDQGVTGAELAVLAANLEQNAARIDLVGLTAKGIEFA